MKRARFLCNECNRCNDNNKTLTYCFNECSVPVDILFEVESKNRKEIVNEGKI